MRFEPNVAVRLKANSELLLIDSIDEGQAIAYCRRIGASGPEGEPQPYPMDSLRENVIRAARTPESQGEPRALRRLRCRLGLHVWRPTRFGERAIIGRVEGRICVHCGEIRLSK